MMNKHETAEGKFNRMSDDAAGDEAENQAVENRRRATRNRIVDYADVKKALAENPNDKVMKEMLSEMEKIMRPIQMEPDSIDAIINYGNEPLEQMGAVASEIIKVQGNFNKQVNVFRDAFANLQTGVQQLNLEELGDAARRLAGTLLDGTVKAGKGVGKTIKSVFNAFGKKASNKKRTEDELLVEKMQEDLPRKLGELLKMVQGLNDTEDGIIQVSAEAERLGKSRIEALRKINLHLGAAKEVMRRYNDEYIKEAEENFKESGDPEDDLRLKNILKRQEGFQRRVNMLYQSRLQSITAAQQLKQMLDTMEDQRFTIKDLLVNGQNEWKTMLAEAGIAASILKVAQDTKKAHEWGDNMHTQTTKMVETAQQMSLEAQSRGAVDPKKLIETATRLQKLIEDENVNARKRLEAMDKTSGDLRDAADKLLETTERAADQRRLESLEESKAARTDKASAEKPAANDDTPEEQKPETAAEDKPGVKRRAPKL